MELIKVPDEIELKDIFIDIHCIGKNPHGEGIVFVIRKENYVIFSGIIDENINEKFLKEQGIEKLDLICWTHPHDDHTDGIEYTIKNHANENTKIVVPIGIFDFEEYMSEKCKLVYEKIKTINKRNTNKNGEYIEVNSYSVLEYTYVDKYAKNLYLKIDVLTPISSRINNIRNNDTCNLNELSICLLISINNICFLFSSDIYNEVIDCMNIDIEKFENIIYYKIPHHGSKESDELLNNIPNSENNRIAVSTIYKNNGPNKTPNFDLLNRYIDKGVKVYCTSGSYINNTKEIYNYGIVSTRIKMENVFQEKKLDWDIKFFGEATEVEKKQESNIIFKSNR